MLGKIIKYEFKSIGRRVLPLYIAIIVFSILFNISNGIIFNNFEGAVDISDLGGIYSIISVIYLVLISTSGLITLGFVGIRFNKSIFGDEGYLTNTLPVSSSSLVFGKMFVGAIFTILSALVVFITVVISIIITVMIPIIQTLDALNIIDFFNSVRFEFNKLGEAIFSITGVRLAIYRLLLEVVGVISIILKIYCSLSLSSLSLKFRKVLFLVYFIILNYLPNIIININYSTNSNIIINKLIINLSWVLIELIVSVICFIITSYIIKKKLNIT